MKVSGRVFPSDDGTSKQQQTEGLILNTKVWEENYFFL